MSHVPLKKWTIACSYIGCVQLVLIIMSCIFVGNCSLKSKIFFLFCVVSVYKQPAGKISPTQPKVGMTGKGRNNTKARDIVAEYSLGVPVAGNFYQAQWDDYVPKLYAKLGM